MWPLLLLVSLAAAQNFQPLFTSSGTEGGRWFHGGMGRGFGRWPCHYPRMVDRLPLDAQAKIRSIWSNWKEGQDCAQERMLTRQLFFTLPQEQRMQIFQAMRQNFLQRHPEFANLQAKGGWPSFWGRRHQWNGNMNNGPTQTR